jgi:glycosyltransferase involved in cell wall biosynthesis
MLASGLRARGHLPLVAIPGEGELAAFLPDSRIIARELSQAALDLRRLAPGCDLIHASSIRSVLLAILARTGKPILFQALIPNRDPMDPVITPFVSLIVCNSEATRNRFHPFADARVLYNGVALHRQARRSLDLPGANRHLLVAGPTSPRKGQTDALPALEMVLAAVSDTDVVFAGSVFGSVGLTLRKAAERWPGRIHLLGRVPNLARHLQEFDLVLVPSRSEGFGRIAVEALRAGVPVLATPIEGLLEALQDHADPWLPEDRRLWADRIRRELEHPTHSPDELRAAAVRYDPDRFLDGMEQCYQEILGVAVSTFLPR